MDPHHRKIDLQAPADLTYLLTNIRTAAQEKLDTAIPPSAAPQGEDAYRSKVEELVQDYIHRTLLLALPNLSINGFDAPPSLVQPAPTNISNANEKSTSPVNYSEEDIATGNYAPYDPRLAERLRGLYARLEIESENVARMRRDVPKKAADAYVKELSNGLEAGREVKRVEDEEIIDVEMDVGFGEAVKGVDRREEMEKTWKMGTEGLEGLGEITQLIGKLERARRAVEVVQGT
ncbi:uncharacterized protein KY384_005858 [Bacidia gigantensis]|uniref:uncharacterized protein n=1 Tax=Bacidia gigantensis TaxID=2732470 RepID=UPI001D0554CD|nr:uncharacterized protein KY384_005858 [Bacidia gigantensis]KAG8529223.1 hypothetical protein KY384_005858 [Bacidia gigantensis]